MKLNGKALLQFCEELEYLLRSGMLLFESVTVISQSSDDRKKKTFINVSECLGRGVGFKTALQESKCLLPARISSVLLSGEETGDFPRALSHSIQLLKNDAVIKSAIIQASVYPCIILLFTVAMTLGIIIFLFPSIIPILSSLDTELPLLTQLVMAISNFLVNQWYIAIALALSLISFCIYGFKNKKVKGIILKGLTKTPYIKNLVIEPVYSSTFVSLGSMVSSGIPMLRACRLVADGLNGNIGSLFLEDLIRSFERGGTSRDVLNDHKDIPISIRALLAAGERSGDLGKVFLSAGNKMESSSVQKMKQLTSFLEPLLLIGMGVVVGALSLSMILPIYSLSETLRQ